MKIDHLPGHVPAHARGITPDNTTTGDAPAPTGDADGADSGGFDDAVAVELSETAQQFSGPGNSVAHQARAALTANIAGDSGVPFGHIVRQIAQGHDFFFAAAAAAAAEEAGEGDSTEAVAPTTDETTGETTGETAETSAPPAEETPVVADGDLAIDLGAGDAADPDLALLEQLIEDLANDDDDDTTV